jgi:spore germination protein YaaH
VGGDVGEWTAHLPDGSTLWWSDARSYRRRADLARQWRLHGLAVWNLQESDPIR